MFQADFDLAKLADDLLGGVSLPWFPDLLSNSPSLTFGLDQVSVGKSVCSDRYRRKSQISVVAGPGFEPTDFGY